jgi:hypothetical protein
VTEHDSQVRIAENVIWREIEGEAVLLDLDKGRYYGLDEMGLQMWSLLEEYGDRQKVVSRLVDEFEVSKDRCNEDLDHFLETLAEHGLVVLGSRQDGNK